VTMARRKFCGVGQPHRAHRWSDEDLSENIMFQCAGTRPLAVNDPVYIKGQKFRVTEIRGGSWGLAILSRRGKQQLQVPVFSLEYDRIAGLWRVVRR